LNRASPTSVSTPTSGLAETPHSDPSACQALEPPDTEEGHVTPSISSTAGSQLRGDAAIADDLERDEHEEGYILGDDPIEHLGDRVLDNASPLLAAVYHVTLGVALLSLLVLALINLHAAYNIGYTLQVYSAGTAYIVGAIETMKRLFSGRLRLWHIVLYIDAVLLLNALGIVLTPVEVWRTLTG
jgi:hypothetical protein